MRVSAIQMDMKFADPAYNFKHAEELIREAAASKPDGIGLPEGGCLERKPMRLVISSHCTQRAEHMA